MRFTIKLVIDDGDKSETVEEIIQLERNATNCNSLGISLAESKQLLKIVQNKIILQQSKAQSELNKICQCCHKKRRIKGYHSLQYRTLFGIYINFINRIFVCILHARQAK